MEALIWIDRKMALTLDRASQETSSPADNEGTLGVLTLYGPPWKPLSVHQCKKDRPEMNPEQSRDGVEGRDMRKAERHSWSVTPEIKDPQSAAALTMPR